MIGTVCICNYGNFTCDMASDSVVRENVTSDRAIPEAVTNWPYSGDLGSVPGHLHAFGICGRQSGNGTDFFFCFKIHPFSSVMIIPSVHHY